MSQLPSIARIVHYRSYGTPKGEYKNECRTALITEVHDEALGIVGLCVLNPTGVFHNQHVKQDEHNHSGGSWHWPERV